MDDRQASLVSPAWAGRSFTTVPPGKPHSCNTHRDIDGFTRKQTHIV